MKAGTMLWTSQVLDHMKKYKTLAGDTVLSLCLKPSEKFNGLPDPFPWQVLCRDKAGRTFINWYTDEGKWSHKHESELDLVEVI